MADGKTPATSLKVQITEAKLQAMKKSLKEKFEQWKCRLKSKAVVYTGSKVEPYKKEKRRQKFGQASCDSQVRLLPEDSKAERLKKPHMYHQH